MSSSKKKKEIIKRLYKHFAEHGFYDLHNISNLSKAVFISRTLFYFYFKDTDDLCDELCEYHKYQVDQTLVKVRHQQLSFIEYSYHLVEVKDLYFFTIRCLFFAEDDPRFKLCLNYSLDHLDQYNFTQFVHHFELSSYPVDSIKFMYDNLRNFWFTHSEPYQKWSRDSVDNLLKDGLIMINLLKSD